jgi:SRSO17 transposase
MAYKYDKTPLYGSLSDFKNKVHLHKVDETKWERFWDELVNENHYLGYASVIGARVKYIISLGKQIVGAISFCSAVYRLRPRDDYIGWDGATREAMLPHLVNNNRFLILPWINISNLASHILSLSLKRLRTDWVKQYDTIPYMAATFVDMEKYVGTCYMAANWVYLGDTKGYGKIGKEYVYHGHKKGIYVYVMDRKFQRRFKPNIARIKDDREELSEMINGTPMWYPSLLNEAGINSGAFDQVRTMLAGHLEHFTPFLGRKEHTMHLASMVQGLMSDLERKSIEPVAIAFEGVDGVRNLTNFMGKSKWDNEGMLSKYQVLLSEQLSDGEAMITGDGTDFPKKGGESVGVARQYCGNLGKVDNCQASVMIGYAGVKGYGLIDYELYMPEQWFGEGYAGKRKKGKVPQKLAFRKKNDIMLDMIIKAYQSGRFPAKYVGVDCSFGSDGDFLDSLPEELIYFADVRCDQNVFAYMPRVYVPKYSGAGRRPTKKRTLLGPPTVDSLIGNSETPWSQAVLGIGAKGPIFIEDKLLRVVEVRNSLPGKEVWLYARKLENGAVKYSLCNADANATIEDIRKPANMRWSIEQCFKECKKYLGMDHYESRTWIAWRRHILITLIAHLFIVKLRILYSRKPNEPGVAPYVDAPVDLDDYIEAYEQFISKIQITHPSISTMPDQPQQFMTIGLIRMMVSASFPKVGAIIKELDYQVRTAKAAFDSHTKAAIEKAFIDIFGNTA